MTTEQLLRDRLDRLTDDVPTGPDLGTSIRGRPATAAYGARRAGPGRRRGGRRRRGRRPGAWSRTTPHTVVRDVPVASGPAPAADFVAGTDFDDTLAAVVAEHLPALPAPDDVYPSDSSTAGPIPDADFASAEDWQAAYTVDGHDVVLITSAAAEPFTCDSLKTTQVPGGQLCTQTYDSEGVTWHGTWLARPDGTSTGLLVGGPALDDTAVAALLQDPRVVFSGA